MAVTVSTSISRDPMRLFSSPSEVGAQTGDAARLRAMLDSGAAFACALAACGRADAAVAAEIDSVCAEGDWDLAEIGEGTAREGTPVPALLRQLRRRLSDGATPVLHHGATSQDVVDTAAMLVAARALVPLRADLDAAADAAAGLAARHRADLAGGGAVA